MRRNSVYERTMMAIVAGFLLVLAGLAARASLFPSTGYSATIDIGGDSTVVWEYLTIPQHRIRWQTGIVDVVPLIDDEMMMGARNLVLKKIGTDRWEIEEEVVEFAPQEHLILAQTSQEFSTVIEYRIRGEGEELVVEAIRNHTWSEFVPRFIAPFHWFSENAALEASMRRLKELVEAA